MADFAANYTARYRLRYSTLGHQHSMLWRIQRGAGSLGLALMVDKVRQFLDATAGGRYTDWTEVSAEYAPEDVDVFGGAALPGGIPGVATLPTNPISQSTLTLGFVGRTPGGTKARLFVFGMNASPEDSLITSDNFRLTTAEAGAVAAGVAELNSGSPSIMGSDNLPVLWYSYANVKYNDHWVAKVR